MSLHSLMSAYFSPKNSTFFVWIVHTVFQSFVIFHDCGKIKCENCLTFRFWKKTLVFLWHTTISSSFHFTKCFTLVFHNISLIFHFSRLNSKYFMWPRRKRILNWAPHSAMPVKFQCVEALMTVAHWPINTFISFIIE